MQTRFCLLSFHHVHVRMSSKNVKIQAALTLPSKYDWQNKLAELEHGF